MPRVIETVLLISVPERIHAQWPVQLALHARTHKMVN